MSLSRRMVRAARGVTMDQLPPEAIAKVKIGLLDFESPPTDLFRRKSEIFIGRHGLRFKVMACLVDRSNLFGQSWSPMDAGMGVNGRIRIQFKNRDRQLEDGILYSFKLVSILL